VLRVFPGAESTYLWVGSFPSFVGRVAAPEASRSFTLPGGKSTYFAANVVPPFVGMVEEYSP
jgi:hypothetical protein